MAPSTAKKWSVVQGTGGSNSLELENVSLPDLGEDDVLVRIRAVSLNFRDLMVVRVR